MVLVPKVHLYIYDCPHLDPSMGVQVTPKFQKWLNLGRLLVYTILGGKVRILQQFFVTEKFLRIIFLEILKLDFQIPGKILSGFLVRNIFWC